MFAFPTEPPSAGGMIVDQLGKPIAHEAVTLTVGSIKLTGFTDSKGAYRFYNCPSGQGKLTIRATDFALTVGPNVPAPTLRLTG